MDMKRLSKLQCFFWIFIWIPLFSVIGVAAVNIMTDDLVVLFIAAFLVYLLGYVASVAITKAAGKPVQNVKYGLIFVLIKALVYSLALVVLTIQFITQGSPLWVVDDHFWIIDSLVLEVYLIVYLIAWAIMAFFSWWMTRKK